MLLFRHKQINRLLALLTGLIFLNMSFFLIELNALEVNKKNWTLYEIFSKAISGISEEEKDAESSETESVSKEVDVCIQQYFTLGVLYTSTINNKYTSGNCQLADGSSCSIHQPPEVIL